MKFISIGVKLAGFYVPPYLLTPNITAHNFKGVHDLSHHTRTLTLAFVFVDAIRCQYSSMDGKLKKSRYAFFYDARHPNCFLVIRNGHPLHPRSRSLVPSQQLSSPNVIPNWLLRHNYILLCLFITCTEFCTLLHLHFDLLLHCSLQDLHLSFSIFHSSFSGKWISMKHFQNIWLMLIAAGMNLSQKCATEIAQTPSCIIVAETWPQLAGESYTIFTTTIYF